MMLSDFMLPAHRIQFTDTLIFRLGTDIDITALPTFQSLAFAIFFEPRRSPPSCREPDRSSTDPSPWKADS